jgi:hypothetical protein
MTQIRAQHPDIESALDANLESNSVEPQGSKTPSWFTRLPTDTLQGDEKTPISHPFVQTPNIEAYEAYRKRMEQRVHEIPKSVERPTAGSHFAPMTGPTQRRPTLPLSEIQGRKKLYRLEEQNHNHQRNSPQNSAFSWGKIIALGSVAICIGGAAGFGFSNAALVKEKYISLMGAAQEKIATLSPAAQVKTSVAKVAAIPASSNETVITKKPISTATLDVSDVRGTLGGMIPLALSAQSADASEPISLKISGLPEQAYLTAGVKSLEGNWTLKPSELAEVKLVVPNSNVKQFDMEVSAVDDLTGALAAPTKAVKVELENALPQTAEIPIAQAGDGKVNSELAAAVPPPAALAPDAIAPAAIVSPVNAMPETAVEQTNEPSAIPKALNEADDLVAKGNALLESGDIVAARQFFTRASELGNAQGSFGVARSYDPKVFAKLNVVGLQPDEKMAADWYKKAADAGVVASTQ